MSDEFVTVAEIAERLKLNQQTVRNWIDRGELPAIRVGARRVRVRSEDLEALLAGSPAAPAPDPEPARAAFDEAMATVQAASEDAALVPALRALAAAANDLAWALR